MGVLDHLSALVGLAAGVSVLHKGNGVYQVSWLSGSRSESICNTMDAHEAEI